MKPPRAERVAIAGPVGEIEALIETPQLATAQVEPLQADSMAGGAHTREVSAFAVVCHPHPLYGGTLDNKVVYTLARAFVELGAPAIRFNFRGVGRSAGQYDDAIGETEDALAVIAYGRQRWPGAALWLAGFSFGGAVAVRAAGRTDVERLVTVAPAVTRFNLEEVATPSAAWLVVQGDADDVVAPGVVLEWASTRSPAPQVSVLPGAGHFFHGRLNDLRESVLAFMRASPNASRP